MMKRFILALALAIVALGIAAPYVQADRYGEQIRSGLQRGLNRKVDIGAVHFNLFTGPGFTIENVIIYEDPSIGIEPFAHMLELRGARGLEFTVAKADRVLHLTFCVSQRQYRQARLRRVERRALDAGREVGHFGTRNPGHRRSNLPQDRRYEVGILHRQRRRYRDAGTQRPLFPILGRACADRSRGANHRVVYSAWNFRRRQSRLWIWNWRRVR